MAALTFYFILLGTLGGTISSELEPSSMTLLKQKVLPFVPSVEAPIPRGILTAKDQAAVAVRDEREVKLTNNVSNIGEVLRKEVQELFFNQSVSVEQLKEDVARMNQSLTSHLKKVSQQLEDVARMNQSLASHLKKVSQQLEDVQSLFNCPGEPPSPQHGWPTHFERKHGSEVSYGCQKKFMVTGNSTVRCHMGKWEGQPPNCTPNALFDPTFTLRARVGSNFYISNVTCSSEKYPQGIQFSRLLDTGTGEALPSGAEVFHRGNEAILDLSSVERLDRRGVYECGYVRDGREAGITFVIARGGVFNHPSVKYYWFTVDVGERLAQADESFRWLHEGKRVPAGDGRPYLPIAHMKKEHAGTYERYKEGDRRGTQVFERLVVRGCPDDFFGEQCDKKCPACYNGGVCHDFLGKCICPAGFEGEQCEKACGKNRFGPNCSESCEGGDCKGHVFCKPDPYGCSCAPGYEGIHCDEKCFEGVFGADCMQSCNCAKGTCDPYTGACSEGCAHGWTGQSCQIPVGN